MVAIRVDSSAAFDTSLRLAHIHFGMYNIERYLPLAWICFVIGMKLYNDFGYIYVRVMELRLLLPSPMCGVRPIGGDPIRLVLQHVREFTCTPILTSAHTYLVYQHDPPFPDVICLSTTRYSSHRLRFRHYLRASRFRADVPHTAAHLNP